MLASRHVVILRNHCSAGDVLVMSAALRDLRLALTIPLKCMVDSHFAEIVHNNELPFVDSATAENTLEIDCSHPPLLNHCNGQPRHYIESFHDLLSQRLGVPIPLTRFAPDLHLSPKEAEMPPLGLNRPYWATSPSSGGPRLTIRPSSIISKAAFASSRPATPAIIIRR
jgi:ADP-heptose:LPS heptosyltransferase